MLLLASAYLYSDLYFFSIFTCLKKQKDKPNYTRIRDEEKNHIYIFYIYIKIVLNDYRKQDFTFSGLTEIFFIIMVLIWELFNVWTPQTPAWIYWVCSENRCSVNIVLSSPILRRIINQTSCCRFLLWNYYPLYKTTVMPHLQKLTLSLHSF